MKQPLLKNTTTKNYLWESPAALELALKLRSKKQLTPEQRRAIIDALFEAGKSGFIVFANWSWGDTKNFLKQQIKGEQNGKTI